MLKHGTAAGGGLLGLLSFNGLSALANTRPRSRSPRDVNRRVWPMSCDTMVALPDATTTGTTVLGKNSDRPVFDCQPLVRHSAKTHGDGATLQLEYRTIPQASRTHATVGSSPYWCWGYEPNSFDRQITRFSTGLRGFYTQIGRLQTLSLVCVFSRRFAESMRWQWLKNGRFRRSFRCGRERRLGCMRGLLTISQGFACYGNRASRVRARTGFRTRLRHSDIPLSCLPVASPFGISEVVTGRGASLWEFA